MNESIKKKINGIGEAGNVISIILIVLNALACLALIAALVLFMLLPKDALTLGFKIDADATVGKSLIGPYLDDIDEKSLDDLNLSVSVGEAYSVDVNTSLEKTEDGLVGGISTGRIAIPASRFGSGLLAALAKLVAALVVLIILNKLSREFKRCDSPFSDGVIRWMTIFAWVLLGASVFSQVAAGIATGVMLRGSGLRINLDLTTLFVTLIVLFLTMIFRYGAKLQREADETL